MKTTIIVLTILLFACPIFAFNKKHSINTSENKKNNQNIERSSKRATKIKSTRGNSKPLADIYTLKGTITDDGITGWVFNIGDETGFNSGTRDQDNGPEVVIFDVVIGGIGTGFAVPYGGDL